MHETFARYQQGFRAMIDVLAAGFAASGIATDRVQLPIRLATDFRTWQIMMRELGMDIAGAVDYQIQIVRCAAADRA
jgi:hypothetical protein